MVAIDFKGKQFVYSHHHSVPYRELKVDKDKSHNTQNPSLDDNLIINGDNLHALKALMPKYAGKIDCIYIDPPYNTGNEGWCYNDNVNAPLIQEWLKKSANPVDKEDMERHDKWLCMMYPRLKLLHELLSDTGVIFISIDENEFYHLKMIMDEIFNDTNCIGYFVWKNKHGGGGDNPHLVKENEFIIAFSKNLLQLPPLFSLAPPDYEKLFRYQDENGKFYLDRLDKKGIDSNRPNLIYPIQCPDGTIKDISPQIWRLSENEFLRRKSEGLIDFRKDKNNEWQVYTKMYLYDKDNNKRRVKARSILKQDIVGFTQNGNKEISEIINGKFPNPKPKNLISYLLDYITNCNKNAIILDSFAGSGTTAHAVLDLNKQDGGNRKFILVEMEDYANDITAERVRRVIDGVPSAKDEALKNGLGGSFTFATLGDEFNIEKILTGESLPSYTALAGYVFYTATGQSLESDIKPQQNWYVGESNTHQIYLIYKPDLAFLRSNESALNLDIVNMIADNPSPKPKLVFATAKFMGQESLKEHKITFCQLPYAIHKQVSTK